MNNIKELYPAATAESAKKKQIWRPNKLKPGEISAELFLKKEY